MNSADYKAEFRVEKADFISLQMPYKFLQCFIANREAFVMVWKDLVCCSEEQAKLPLQIQRCDSTFFNIPSQYSFYNKQSERFIFESTNRKPLFRVVPRSLPYLLELAPRRLFNFSRHKCGAYLRAALI